MPLMSSKWVTHQFGGGWATDYGPTAYNAPNEGAVVQIPYLLDARNTIYEFDGGVRKCEGANLLNASALEAGSPIMGIYDHWFQGTAGSPTQRRIVHVGTKIKYDQGDGTFTDLFTGVEAGQIPNFSTFDDLLIIGTTATTEVPRSWDGNVAQNLAGSPPRFSFSVFHKNRQWAAGDFTHPSRLYYSSSLNPEEWTGGTSGSIDIDPNDGDMITGIISHKNELWVFKGPYRGSIHRITGSSQSDFARTTFISGIGSAWMNTIFRFGDDIGFMTAYGTVHSLKTTANFGDYNQSYFSYPIGTYVRERLNHGRHRYFVSATDPANGRIWLGVTPSGQSTNTRCLIMDYRFLSDTEPYPRWSYWDAKAFASMSLVRDTNQRVRLFAGGYDGYVYRLGQENRTVNGTAINFRVETPALTYGDEWLLKNVGDIALSLDALNANNVTVGWTGDGTVTNSATVNQGSVGGKFDSALFDTDVFGGQTFIPRFCGIENGGDFRAISYNLTDSANNSDISVHRILVKLAPAGESQENA